ncbi:MAG: alanine racemase [Oscillospiraceae bacterium]|nr:alanine racemase [Oscillospiraceae bacterium]
MDKKFVINKSDIQNNISVLREKVGSARIYAVLKGNAYGMGLIPFAKELFDGGIGYFALTSLSDCITLKQELPDANILLLTPCHIDGDIKAALSNDITLSADSLKNADAISKIAQKQNKTANIHIKIDTGMGRYGFLPSQIAEIKSACRLDSINAEGIFTHLHSAFNKKAGPSLEQFSQFTDVIDKLKTEDITFEVSHICNSTAIFRFPQMHLTAVRAGSALIGRVNTMSGASKLCKVGKLYGQIIDIRTLPQGHNIGYAALHKTKASQKILCVNVGYADGVAVTKANDTFRFIDILRYGFNDFKLLFKPTLLVCTTNGKSAKSLGRIGMTNLVLDGSNCEDAKIGDLVEIPANPIYLSPLIQREYK